MSPLAEVIGVFVAAAVIVWVAGATFLPEYSCRWCGGTGKNPWSNSKLRGPCWFCGGHPWRMRRRARLVRRVWRSLWGSKRWGK